MTISHEELLAAAGWQRECESPLEIRHPDGSFASGQAAILVIADLREDATADKQGTALRPPEPLGAVIRTLEAVIRTLDRTRAALWLQLEPKHGTKAASEYPEIVEATTALALCRAVLAAQAASRTSVPPSD